jgi:hypothetical protein
LLILTVVASSFKYHGSVQIFYGEHINTLLFKELLSSRIQ